MVGLLDDVGFSPERRLAAGVGQIGLSALPVPRPRPGTYRRGLPGSSRPHARALAAMGAAITVEKLEPFVESDLCLAHLGPAEVSA